MAEFSVADADLTRRHRAFTELYSNHHSWLHGWLRKKLGCSQRAADLAQDAFVRVLTLSEPQDIKEPRAFLVTMAGRLLIDGTRRRQVEQAYLEDVAGQAFEAGMPNPEAIHVAREALDKIAVILDHLPARSREAFMLSRLEGLTYSEIAPQLNVSASTVKNDVAAALSTVHGSERPS